MMIATEKLLTKEQIKEFHEKGFLVLRDFVSKDEIKMMIPLYEKLFNNKTGRDQGSQFDLGGTDVEGEKEVLPQILGPSRFEPGLRDGQHYQKVSQLVTELFGKEQDVNGIGDHAILKPGNYGSVTPWHQDEAYWSSESIHESFSVWLPLQEASVESGCLQFIPGSHKNGIVEHQHINNDPRIHALETFDYDDSKAVACPLKLGDVTIHHCRTLHYAAANNTDNDRLALIVTGHGSSTKLDKPKDLFWQDQEDTARSKRRKEFDDKESN